MTVTASTLVFDIGLWLRRTGWIPESILCNQLEFFVSFDHLSHSVFAEEINVGSTDKRGRPARTVQALAVMHFTRVHIEAMQYANFVDKVDEVASYNWARIVTDRFLRFPDDLWSSAGKTDEIQATVGMDAAFFGELGQTSSDEELASADSRGGH